MPPLDLYIACISESISGTAPNAEVVKEGGPSYVDAHGNQASIRAFEGFQKISCLTADQRREGHSLQEEKLTVDVSFILFYSGSVAV